MPDPADLPTDLPEDLSFEAALQQLEAIVADLENDVLPLEDALAKYEQGVHLARFCQDRLNTAEMRVQELTLE